MPESLTVSQNSFTEQPSNGLSRQIEDFSPFHWRVQLHVVKCANASLR